MNHPNSHLRSIIWLLLIFTSNIAFSQTDFSTSRLRPDGSIDPSGVLDWEQTSGPYGGPLSSPAINSIGDVFAGTGEVGNSYGILRSTDNGNNWTRAARIFVDGVFSDWDNLSPLHVDTFGDQASGVVDFGQLWGANDERFFFLRIQIGGEMNIDKNNDIAMFIDTDNNPATGIQVHGVGAELEWNFGNKTGFFVIGSDSISISHSQIEVVMAPTVTSTQFEVAFYRTALPDGQTPLFQSDTLRLVFADRGIGGDLLPDGGNGVLYVFDDSPLPPLQSLTLRRQAEDHLRVLSYNVLFDGLFEPARVPSFERILRAIEPNLIGFQEIYDHNAQETANQVESMLPSSGGEQWYSSKVPPDIVAVSRYQITGTYAIQDNGAFLIDLRPAFNSDLLLIVAHPPCCANNEGRQREIDAMMAFIRDAKAPGGVLDLEENTPILIVGDLNLVGFAQQLETLLTGDIVDTGTYGPAFTPDWNGSDFADLMPRHTDLPMTFTWYRDASVWPPGRLDFIVYSESVMDAGNHFVLFTQEMPADTLAAYGLQQDDATFASDHLPVVSDFALAAVTGLDLKDQESILLKFSLEQNYPNPFNPSTTIRYELSSRTHVVLKIFNVLGQEVATLLDEEKSAGRYEVSWDADGFSSGIYFYRLQAQTLSGQAGGFVETKRLILIR